MDREGHYKYLLTTVLVTDEITKTAFSLLEQYITVLLEYSSSE
jgi:hypothetical protein